VFVVAPKVAPKGEGAGTEPPNPRPGVVAGVARSRALNPVPPPNPPVAGRPKEDPKVDAAGAAALRPRPNPDPDAGAAPKPPKVGVAAGAAENPPPKGFEAALAAGAEDGNAKLNGDAAAPGAVVAAAGALPS
jgi:outer membrane biosynthesis protein TonB